MSNNKRFLKVNIHSEKTCDLGRRKGGIFGEENQLYYVKKNSWAKLNR